MSIGKVLVLKGKFIGMAVGKIPLIINADPGIDDAMAIVLALASEKLDVKLLASSAGNLSIDIVTRNCLHLIEKMGKKVPVARGAVNSMYKNRENFAYVHGDGGFGTYVPTAPTSKELPQEAFEEMYNVLKKSRKKVTILSLGPLTNLAKLLTKYPDSKHKIEEIVFMGSTKEEENIYNPRNNNKTVYASSNVNYDPVATEIIISSGVKVVFVPSEMGHNAYLDLEDIKQVSQFGEIGKMLHKMFETYKDGHVDRKMGVATHDSCALAYILDPKLFKEENVSCNMNWYNKGKDGVLFCDIITGNIESIHKMCVDIDDLGFKKLVFEILRGIEN